MSISVNGVVEDAVSLLLYAGKSVLLVGPPGAGKTRLAIAVSERYTLHSPVIVVGRGDLSSRDLVYRYEPVDGGVRVVLGELSLAVLSSWARLANGLPPVWLVVDELNRMNAEVALGPLFTALDMAHRSRVSVVPLWLSEKVLEDQRLWSIVYARAAGGHGVLGEGEAREGLRRIMEAVRERGLEGLPLPLSWRMLATMNMYDRSHLFRVGFALLRRLPPLLVPGLESYQPRLSQQKADKELGGQRELVERACGEASRELWRLDSLVTYDRVFYGIPLGDEGLREVVEEYSEALGVLLTLAARARELGIAIGPALFVDACKLAVAAYYMGLRGEKGNSIVADIVVSSLLLPQLASVAQRVRAETILYGASKTAQRLDKLLQQAQGLLGDKSMTAAYAEALRLELPPTPM